MCYCCVVYLFVIFVVVIIIIIIILFWEVFIPALADDFSLVFKWQRVSLSLPNLSQYSGRS